MLDSPSKFCTDRSGPQIRGKPPVTWTVDLKANSN